MLAKNIIYLETSSIFDWVQIISYLSREEKEVMYQVANDRIKRLFKVENEFYLCTVFYNEQVQEICIQAENQTIFSAEARKVISNFVRDWLDLDQLLDDFYQFAQEDNILSPLVQKFYGLRLIGVPDFYEAITWGILGQQVNLAYAYTLKERFVKKYGEAFHYNHETYWLYPKPKMVANSMAEELLELQMTRKKAEYLQTISKLLYQGTISKSYYQKLDTAEQIEKELLKLYGVGPWTAHYVMMRCFRIQSAFPMADIGLQNGISYILGLEEKPSKELLLKLKNEWGTWCSYAVFYIWRLLY